MGGAKEEGVASRRVRAEERVKRRRNTEAARRSQERRRESGEELERHLLELIRENARLRAQLQALRRHFAPPGPVPHPLAFWDWRPAVAGPAPFRPAFGSVATATDPGLRLLNPREFPPPIPAPPSAPTPAQTHRGAGNEEGAEQRAPVLSRGDPRISLALQLRLKAQKRTTPLHPHP